LVVAAYLRNRVAREFARAEGAAARVDAPGPSPAGAVPET